MWYSEKKMGFGSQIPKFVTTVVCNLGQITTVSSSGKALLAKKCLIQKKYLKMLNKKKNSKQKWIFQIQPTQNKN